MVLDCEPLSQTSLLSLALRLQRLLAALPLSETRVPELRFPMAVLPSLAPPCPEQRLLMALLPSLVPRPPLRCTFVPFTLGNFRGAFRAISGRSRIDKPAGRHTGRATWKNRLGVGTTFLSQS